MFCVNCGRQLADTAKFCPHCGQACRGSQQPPQQRNDIHQLPVGTMLRSRYQVGAALGQGGFGITYLGYDTLMETQVAIKEFYPGSLVSRNTAQTLAVQCHTQRLASHFYASRERFLREAKALVRFKHIPEVVDILDFVEENNTAYIIMEYVQGMSLVKYVASRGGRLTAEETFRILKPVMEALAAVHSGGIVHRDIAPDNIILHPTGGAKLLDFGAVRAVESGDADAELAKSTEAILKHGFAPIEQYNSRGGLGPWTDIYAMCATVYYCLTGQIPPEASVRISDGVDPDWKSIPGLTASQVAALEKGMALRAKDRHPNMEALMRALFAPAAQPRPQSAAQPRPQSAPQPRPQPKPQSAPQPRPQPKPQSAPQSGKTGGGKSLWDKIAIFLVIAVGGFFACMAIYNHYASEAKRTSLGEHFSLYPPEWVSIQLFDGTYTIRSASAWDEAEIQEVWDTINGREIQITEPEDIADFWRATHDERNISLYIWGGEFGKHMSIYVTPEGEMYFHSSADDLTMYFTAAEEIYTALNGFLPEGEQTSVRGCIPDRNWTFLQLDFIDGEGALIDSVATDNGELIGGILDELWKLDVKFGGGLYTDFGGCRAQLRLSAEDGSDYYITVYDDGSTELEMGKWTYGFYGAVDLYEVLCWALTYIRG